MECRESDFRRSHLSLIDKGAGAIIKRLYPGWLQRSEGAWSFAIDDEQGNELGGSQWNCKEIIRHHRRGGKFFVQRHDWGTFSLYPIKEEL